jgi:hypothetical protein
MDETKEVLGEGNYASSFQVTVQQQLGQLSPSLD